MPKRLIRWSWWKRHQAVLAFLLITVVFVVTVVWVQDGRLHSCKRTYEGVRQIFHPFLTPPPGPRDGKRYRDYLKFNHRVDELKAQCDSQVKLWWPGG